jgi:hypothetical protein
VAHLHDGNLSGDESTRDPLLDGVRGRPHRRAMRDGRRRRARLDALVHSLTGALLTACSDYHDCPVPDPVIQASLPARLSETGLFAPGATELAPGVRPYTPSFALWSDGAEKRRWIALPEGARIDTSDMDAWRFPVGTKVWKEFVRDGIRVETRLLEKVDASDAGWAGIAYAWAADRSDAAERDGDGDGDVRDRDRRHRRARRSRRERALSEDEPPRRRGADAPARDGGRRRGRGRDGASVDWRAVMGR